MSVHWIAADWAAPNGIVAGCTTRSGGVSRGTFESLNLGDHVGDLQEHVAENRQRFVSQCRLPAEPLWLAQVHGTAVSMDPEPGCQPAADAVLTRAPNTVCAVLTADCLPMLLVSVNGDELGAVHAGWRGLCNGVLESTLEAFQAPPEQILAWLGPAIAQRNFEVGDEVREAYLRHDEAAGDCFAQNDRGRWQADLYGLARQRLNAAGVHRVSGGEICTYDDSKRFFSYRRDGQCGRMASFVFRHGDTPESA